ncbi:MAG: hypothetical protein ISS65_02955 [Desulfobacterales bacterium]|uniref:Uncharacterized protein n=1 Tax=Candidatus Desulfatibia profunda TaxID=2841695 RepID=A0A8J6NYM2_9BACT|nr:hypothetical protein [Candidatus Desulfatibia profunda]MBL7179156.1 hypothetical protein [Desulfobacterales bacterium]
MDITASKALVSNQRLVPAPKRLHAASMCLDLYPRRCRNEVVFTVRKTDESEGKYGPDGRKRENPKCANFIDIFV